VGMTTGRLAVPVTARVLDLARGRTVARTTVCPSVLDRPRVLPPDVPRWATQSVLQTRHGRASMTTALPIKLSHHPARVNQRRAIWLHPVRRPAGQVSPAGGS